MYRAKMGQCKSITNKGVQCKREALPHGSYCWQHNKPFLFSLITIISILGFLIGLWADLFSLGFLEPKKNTEIALQSSVLPNNLSSLIDSQAGWIGCTLSMAYVLPDNIIPKKNSYNTLGEIPDIGDWPRAPIESPPPPPGEYPEYYNFPSGSVLPGFIRLWNKSTEEGKWLRVENRIHVKLDLVSPNIENHSNLLFVSASCGGGFGENFSPVILSQEPDFLNQTIVSDVYDFFSLQPGEFVEFGIDFVCTSPGIYQPSATILINSLDNSEYINVTGFGTILCPKSFSLWRTEVNSSKPLEFSREYYWTDEGYKVKP